MEEVSLVVTLIYIVVLFTKSRAQVTLHHFLANLSTGSILLVLILDDPCQLITLVLSISIDLQEGELILKFNDLIVR